MALRAAVQAQAPGADTGAAQAPAPSTDGGRLPRVIILQKNAQGQVS